MQKINYIVVINQTNMASAGTSFLEGFLRLMVFALVAILIAIPVCILLDLLGII